MPNTSRGSRAEQTSTCATSIAKRRTSRSIRRSRALTTKQSWQNAAMSREQQSPTPPEVRSSSEDAPEAKIATVDTDASPLAVFAPAPQPVDAAMLIDGLRYLQQRIPIFVTLSTAEKRSMLRAASLDPEFRATGVRAAELYPPAKGLVGMSGAEMRVTDEEAVHWDAVIREARILIKGMDDGNLKRKYRLGTAILQLYSILSVSVEGPGASHPDLKPYFEDMKRAYLRWRRKSSRKAPDKEPEPAKE
jgi:hypothetical protein